MGSSPAPLRFSGVPEQYDPDKITTNIQDALDQVTAYFETPAPDAPLSLTTERNPSYKNVRRLALNVTAGTYGGADDPRVARVVEQSDSGLCPDGQSQRFRFETGAALFPLARFPTRSNMWAIQNVPPLFPFTQPMPTRVAFGCLVPKIQHHLKKIPERVSMRTSAGMEGPTGQLVKGAGTGLYLPIGMNVRCDFDFLPVFGLTADDIEWRLKHLLSFTSGLFGSDDQGGVIPFLSTYENPAVRRQAATDMVTTTQHFGGLLLATAWGWSAAAANVGIADAGPPIVMGNEVSLVNLRNPVNDLDDGMINVPIPELGKSLFALPTTSTSLATMLGTGLRLVLHRGTVDFVLE